MKRILFGGILCVLGVVSGCATITTGTSQSVTVVTEKDVSGASCELADRKGGKWYVNATPGTVSVRKGDGPMSIVCNKEGFKTASIMVEESVSGATLGNVLIGGGIGIFIDAMSGSAQRYPDEIIVWMKPENWLSEEEKVAWEEAKQAYEEKLATEKEALKKSQSAPFGS